MGEGEGMGEWWLCSGEGGVSGHFLSSSLGGCLQALVVTPGVPLIALRASMHASSCDTTEAQRRPPLLILDLDI